MNTLSSAAVALAFATACELPAGALYESCEGNADCADELCLDQPGPDGTVGYCTRRCTSASECGTPPSACELSTAGFSVCVYHPPCFAGSSCTQTSDCCSPTSNGLPLSCFEVGSGDASCQNSCSSDADCAALPDGDRSCHCDPAYADGALGGIRGIGRCAGVWDCSTSADCCPASSCVTASFGTHCAFRCTRDSECGASGCCTGADTTVEGGYVRTCEYTGCPVPEPSCNCGDGSCSSRCGETSSSCPSDCGGGTEDECSSDNDCASRHRCRSGRCVSVECTNDVHCGSCERCSSDVCSYCGEGPYGCYC